MEEFFVNDFVVKVETGHPGYVSYRIIAKSESWRKLAAELATAVEKCERTEQSKGHASTFPSLDSLGVWHNGEFALLSRRATISKGKTSRVAISFSAAKDLGIHHVRPTWFKILWSNSSCLFGGSAMLGILYLAAIGAATILGGFFNAR